MPFYKLTPSQGEVKLDLKPKQFKLVANGTLYDTQPSNSNPANVSTNKALIRNNGTHATAATNNKVVRWNQQVLQRLNDDLAVGWATFDNRLVEQGDDLQTSIQQGFTSLRRQSKDAPQALMSVVNLKELDLDFWLQENFSAFLLNLRTIQYNATGDHASSLVLAKMVPIDRAYLMEAGTGRGTMARMYAAMEFQMSRRDIFRYIFGQMKMAIVTAINETKNALINQVIVTSASIQQQIDTTTGGEANEASKRHPEDLERLQSSMVFFRNSLHELQEQAAIVRQQARRLGYVQ